MRGAHSTAHTAAGPGGGKPPREIPASAFYHGIQAIQPGNLRLRQHMPLDRRTHITAGELAADRALLNIQRTERKHVMTRDAVVPRRARAVVTMVVADMSLFDANPNA